MLAYIITSVNKVVKEEKRFFFYNHFFSIQFVDMKTNVGVIIESSPG